MAKIDLEYSELCKKILNDGYRYENINRGVERLQIPSYLFKHDFKDGFPAITNKKLFWKGVVGELLWFLRGDNDISYLTRNGIYTWNKDAFNWHQKTEDSMKTQEDFDKVGCGSVGQNYSVQWRNYNGKTDQIAELISNMKKDIMSSRLVVSAWNPSEVDMTALPPCHIGFQIVGVPLGYGEFGFELHWKQRSVDVFLGLPFNIASYALLAKILEDMTGYKALLIEGYLECVHFYDNQYEAAKELISRDPGKHPNCELMMWTAKRFGDNLDSYLADCEIDDFELKGYSSDAAIKVDMLAPKQ